MPLRFMSEHCHSSIGKFRFGVYYLRSPHSATEYKDTIRVYLALHYTVNRFFLTRVGNYCVPRMSEKLIIAFYALRDTFQCRNAN